MGRSVAMILSTVDNQRLSAEDKYRIIFSQGMIKGSGITVNPKGDSLLFEKEGSYHFEFCGEAVVFSDTSVKLVYKNKKFTTEMTKFTEISVPKETGKLKFIGLSTILPIGKGEKLTLYLKPEIDTSIMLLDGARLLVNRVA